MSEIEARAKLTEAMRYFHSRGWTPGTGGNFSVVVHRDPLTLLMSPSGVDKGSVASSDLILVNQCGEVTNGAGAASAETKLHLEIVKARGAGSVLHVHSVWNTILSRRFLAKGAVRISGFEMLKSLGNNTTHDCEEVIPVLENSQDMNELSERLNKALTVYPAAKGVLLAGHGLYTWGADIHSARRHVEGFEFLFEVVGRESCLHPLQ